MADWICRVNTNNLPSVVVEAGWSENYPKLVRDKDLWIIGCAPEVQVVFLLNWTKITQGRVKGVIQVWDPDAVGNPNLRQEEVDISSLLNSD